MNRRLIVFILGFAPLSLGLLHSAEESQRPNLLFIMLDDLGVGQCQFANQELSVDQFDPYFKRQVSETQDYTPEQALEFAQKAMPNLTRLAEQGIHFTKAYAASSLCAPARLAVATAKIPPDAGVYTNMDVENSGIQSGEHLALKLQEAGYATAHIGKWHIGKRDNSIIRRELSRAGIDEEIYFFDLRGRYPEIYNRAWDAGYYGSVVPEQNPLNNGFDYYYGYNNWASQFYDSPLVWEGFEHADRQPGYNTEVFTERALDFIKKQGIKDQPFFVQIHYHAVHDYLEPNAPDRYWNGIRSSSYALSNFYAHIQAVDENVQRILDYLESSGQLENTLIVFTSDNGAMAGGPNVLPGNAPYSGHKGTFQQGGIRVPLFFHWAKGIQRHGTSDALVSSMDIMPTFIDAAQLELPTGIDGKSLLPLLSGNDVSPVREYMVWSGIHARAWGFLHNTSLVPKYLERQKAPGGWAVVKGEHVLRFRGNVEAGLYEEAPDGSAARLELYDLKTDPAESNDLKNQLPETLETLKSIYEKEARNFKAPVVWNADKWMELMPSTSR
ncbi:MAG: sulfatase family protein [Opitutaceae bacterium]